MPETPYAETEMLLAAMNDDHTTLHRLAAETTPTERRYLTRALNQVYDALAAATYEGVSDDSP